MSILDTYQYRGARALVLLHEEHLRSFVATWHEAKAASIALPETDDSDYDSLEHVLQHVLGAARGYMVWMCEKLELAHPDIHDVPALDAIESEAEAFLHHLLERWRLPLANVPVDDFGKTYRANWGIQYSIDAMLEHALVHPMRHTFQLRNLINEQKHP